MKKTQEAEIRNGINLMLFNFLVECQKNGLDVLFYKMDCLSQQLRAITFGTSECVNKINLWLNIWLRNLRNQVTCQG